MQANNLTVSFAPTPDPEKMRAHRKFSPTSFADYLRSPRLFYFKHILKLHEQNFGAREMDAAAVGSFLHLVLQEFATAHLGVTLQMRGSEIRKELHSIVEKVFDEIYGETPLVALPFQREMLDMRLAAFAEVQVGIFAEGWVIRACEYTAQVELDIRSLPSASTLAHLPPPLLRGKIDRIDFHPETGQWRVIDYKSGSESDPTRKHATVSVSEGITKWKELQFPLYAKLLPAIAEELGAEIPIEKTQFFYFCLPAELDKVGLSDPFDNNLIEPGQAEAHRIVEEVISGEGCREIGKFAHYDSPTLRALCGNAVSIEDSDEVSFS